MCVCVHVLTSCRSQPSPTDLPTKLPCTSDPSIESIAAIINHCVSSDNKPGSHFCCMSSHSKPKAGLNKWPLDCQGLSRDSKPWPLYMYAVGLSRVGLVYKYLPALSSSFVVLPKNDLNGWILRVSAI